MFIHSTDVFIQSNFRIQSKEEIQRKVRTIEAVFLWQTLNYHYPYPKYLKLDGLLIS